MKKNGHRYCPICKNKLKKNGKNQSKSQNGYCRICKKSFVLGRNDLKKKYEVRRHANYLISNESQDELSIPSRTFRKQSQPLGGVAPEIPETGEVHDVIVIDGIGIRNKQNKNDNQVCLIARTPKFVIGGIGCKYESKFGGETLLVKFPPPKFVVCDGKGGMLSAIKNTWKTSEIQRCVFHVMKNIRAKLTKHPKTEAGINLKFIASDLANVYDEMTSRMGTAKLLDGYEIYKDFLSQKTFMDVSNLLRPRRRWGYTHKSLRSAYRQLITLVENGTLFTFIRHPEIDIPRTTNFMEGGINSQLRNLLKIHRGMPFEHRKRLIEEYLYSRSEK